MQQSITLPLKYFLDSLFRVGLLDCVVLDNPEVIAALEKVIDPAVYHWETLPNGRRLWITARWKETELAKAKHNERRQTRNELSEELFAAIKKVSALDDRQVGDFVNMLMTTGNENAAKAFGIENFAERWAQAKRTEKGITP